MNSPPVLQICGYHNAWLISWFWCHQTIDVLETLDFRFYGFKLFIYQYLLSTIFRIIYNKNKKMDWIGLVVSSVYAATEVNDASSTFSNLKKIGCLGNHLVIITILDELLQTVDHFESLIEFTRNSFLSCKDICHGE